MARNNADAVRAPVMRGPMARMTAAGLGVMLLAGCATTGNGGDRASGFEDGDPAVTDCRSVAQDSEAETLDPGIYLQGAHRCLDEGEFRRAQDLSRAFQSHYADHADADYASYTEVMADLGQWTRGRHVETAQRIESGRDVFRSMADFMDTYPGSRYTESMAPRLVEMREELARLELRKAESVAESGNEAEARERREYVKEYYANTDVARNLKESNR